MILSVLPRLFLASDEETGRKIMFISRNWYRLLANNEIPVRPSVINKISIRNLTLSRNAFFTKIDYPSMQDHPFKKYFKLVEDKDVKSISWQWIFGLLKLKNMDNSFSFTDFKENSEEVLCIVSHKIAGEEFSDLEELLTPECLNEVKNNIRKLGPEEKRLFPLQQGEGTFSWLSKIYVDSDSSSKGSEFEEKIVTIILISSFMSPNGIDAGQKYHHVLKEYHTEFKRSYKNDIKSHWIISDMNMRCVCV